MRDDVTKKAAGAATPTVEDERNCMQYITDFDELQEQEVEMYDFFNDGYPSGGYDDEFEGWRDLVL